MSKSLSSQDQTITVFGRAWSIGPTAAGTTFTIAESNLIIANLGARVIAIADCYQYWRMIKLKIHQILLPSTSFTWHGLGFIPVSQADFTAATAFNTMVDFPHFVQHTQQNDCVITVDRNGLLGSIPEKWLETNQNEANVYSSAGTITSAIQSSNTDTTSSIRFYIEFELQFKTPIDPALNPMIKKRSELTSDIIPSSPSAPPFDFEQIEGLPDKAPSRILGSKPLIRVTEEKKKR